MDNTQDQKQKGSYIDTINDLRRLRGATRVGRAAVVVVQTVINIVFAFGPLIAFFGFILLMAVIIIVIFNPPPVGQCSAIPNFECKRTSCGELVEDQTGATCGTQYPDVKCCVPKPACIGSCQAGTTCADSEDTIDPTAFCSGAPNQICCVPPGTQPPLHFYCQYDRKYTSSACDITGNGCTPTSVAMVLATFGGTQTPSSTALANGSNGCFSGSSIWDFTGYMRNQGYTVGQSLANRNGFNISQAQTFISQGYYIIAGANVTFRRNGPISVANGNGNHAFVISAIDSAGNATVYDPTFCTSDGNYVTRIINVNSGTLCNINGCGWYWAVPVKK